MDQLIIEQLNEGKKMLWTILLNNFHLVKNKCEGIDFIYLVSI